MEPKKIFVMILAIAVALLMGFDPKFFVRNPSHRTETYLKRVGAVGKAVALVLIVGFAVMIFQAIGQ